MKLLTIALLSLTALSSFAQTTPNFTINDEAFRDVIESSLQRSPYAQMLNEKSTINAVASFSNKTCSLQLSVKNKNSSFSIGLTESAKNLEKCQQKIARAIEK